MNNDEKVVEVKLTDCSKPSKNKRYYPYDTLVNAFTNVDIKLPPIHSFERVPVNKEYEPVKVKIVLPSYYKKKRKGIGRKRKKKIKKHVQKMLMIVEGKS